MDTYTVKATIQSKQPDAQPVEVQWYSGTNGLSVMSSVAQLMERTDTDNPFSPVLRSITITVIEGES